MSLVDTVKHCPHRRHRVTKRRHEVSLSSRGAAEWCAGRTITERVGSNSAQYTPSWCNYCGETPYSGYWGHERVADNYAVSVLCEALGAGVPMVLVPFVKDSLAGHPSWLASLAVLSHADATLVDPRDGSVNAHEPLRSGTGDAVTDAFDWSWVFDQFDRPTS